MRSITKVAEAFLESKSQSNDDAHNMIDCKLQTTNKTAPKKDTTKSDDTAKFKLQNHLPAVGQYLQDHISTGMDLITLNHSIGLEPWNLYSIRNSLDYLWNSLIVLILYMHVGKSI